MSAIATRIAPGACQKVEHFRQRERQDMCECQSALIVFAFGKTLPCAPAIRMELRDKKWPPKTGGRYGFLTISKTPMTTATEWEYQTSELPNRPCNSKAADGWRRRGLQAPLRHQNSGMEVQHPSRCQ